MGLRSRARRPAAASALAAAILAMAGCSEFPDPYTNRCPTISRLVLSELTSVGARLSWETDRLGVTRVQLRKPDGLEELIEDRTQKNVHAVTLANLFPDTDYRVEILPDRGLGTCDGAEVVEFRTRPLREESAPPTSPVTDPEETIFPCTVTGTCP